MRFKLINKRKFVVCLLCVFIVLIIISIIIGVNKNKKNIKKPVQNITVTQKTYPHQVKTPIKKVKIYYDIPISHELQDFIREMCFKYEVDMDNIISIINIESEFKHNVKSKNLSEHGYSIGYMQLNAGSYDYIKWYSELTNIKNFNPKNEKHNIEAGIAVYKFYKTYWQNKSYVGDELLIRILNSYNCGIVGYKKYIRNTGKISRSYDRKIFRYKKDICKLKIIK